MPVTPPDDPAPARAGRTGTVLVAAQLALLGLIVALAAPALWRGLRHGDWPATGAALPGVLLGLGTALGLWALAANRPHNFNIRPDPRAGAQLVVHGPYRWMRHPMYTALLAACAGLVAVSASFWAGVAWIVLVGVLDRKAALEETLLARVHPGYADYAARTRRFLPGVV